jgi:predicted  nucleic acid-binding Zn-ribbon protein
MNPTEALIRVSLLDSELWRITERRKIIQSEIQTLNKNLQAEVSRYNQIIAQLASVKSKVDSSSTQLHNEKHQFEERVRRISSGGSGQMLKALQRENDRVTLVIEAAGKELERQQSELQEISLKAEEADRVLTDKKAQVEGRLRELDSQLSNLTDSYTRIEKQVSVIRSELDPEHAYHYGRLRSRYSDPVAELDDNSCAACNASIPLRLTNQIKAGVPTPCPECDRFVVVSMAVAGDDSGELI